MENDESNGGRDGELKTLLARHAMLNTLYQIGVKEYGDEDKLDHAIAEVGVRMLNAVTGVEVGLVALAAAIAVDSSLNVAKGAQDGK